MVTGTLVFAVDYRRDTRSTRTVYSYRSGGAWYVVRSGPTYANTYMVDACDSQGEAWLASIERVDTMPPQE